MHFTYIKERNKSTLEIIEEIDMLIILGSGKPSEVWQETQNPKKEKIERYN